MFARDSLDLAQIGKITRSANHSHGLVVFIKDWLNRNQQRTIETIRRDLDRHTATCFECIFNHTRFVFFAGSQDVATLATEQQARMNRFHRRAGSVDTFQFAGAIEDKDAVRHRVEGRFPFGLSTRHHLEQLSLRDADGQSFCQRFDKRDFIFSPETFSICLMDAE